MSGLLKRTKVVMGVYDDDVQFIDAIRKMRAARIEIKNAYTPFPMHGLDDLLGLKQSKLGYGAFIFGAIGALIGISLIAYTMHIDWPLNIGGKPSLPGPSMIPITFELTVLIASLGMITVYFLRNSMLPGFEPKIYHSRSTQDRFVVLVEEANNKENIVKFLEETGAVEIADEEYIEQNSPLPLPIKMK